ncbi:ribosome biogenesis GTPase YlqF [Liberiplasma polymorphum]|uniref:ribosome biogenesis GTPase YlqF n=1 Tax=Liberiplasma polymorphum TaxID=3374570 RepID=UPI0037739E24
MKAIQWYPGHMAKTKRLIKEKLKHIDVVFELLDARAPLSSQNPLIHDITSKKPRLILLNKADLADQKILTRWEKYFQKQGHYVLKINSLSGMNVQKIAPTAKLMIQDVYEKEKSRGRLERPVRAMILGIPNVGKSTLINSLVSKRVTKVGDIAGITKHLQMIRIHDDLELLDTPGILWPKFEDQEVGFKLALLGSIKDHILPLDDIVIYGFKFLDKYYKEAFEARYDITVDIENIGKIFDDIGIKRGCLRKGGEVDYDRVIDMFLQDFRHMHFGQIMLDRL